MLSTLYVAMLTVLLVSGMLVIGNKMSITTKRRY